MKEHNSILMYQSDMPTDVNTADDNHSQPPLPELKAQSDVGVPRPLSSAATTEPSMRSKSAATKAKRTRATEEAPSLPVAAHIQSEVKKAVEELENRLDVSDTVTSVAFDVNDILPEAAEEMGAEATIRFLKAKVRVMQEEVDRLYLKSNEHEKENNDLKLKLKDLVEQNSKLQNSYQQAESMSDRNRQAMESLKHKCEGLEAQLAATKKELEEQKLSQKKAASSQSSVEVRLNRALEEAEKYRTALQKERAEAKELSKHDKQQLEHLVSENRQLEKQKAELMTGFKKQLKLIDILKRQKMHIEAAKVLNFTEEEFIKALDWGAS